MHTSVMCTHTRFCQSEPITYSPGSKAPASCFVKSMPQLAVPDPDTTRFAFSAHDYRAQRRMPQPSDPGQCMVMQIDVLKAGWCKIGEKDGAKAIADLILFNTTLTTLDLRGNGLSNPGDTHLTHLSCTSHIHSHDQATWVALSGISLPYLMLLAATLLYCC